MLILLKIVMIINFSLFNTIIQKETPNTKIAKETQPCRNRLILYYVNDCCGQKMLGIKSSKDPNFDEIQK
jgi:hypothetical protein